VASVTSKCLTPECTAQAIPQFWGQCAKCHTQAKKLVAEGKTTRSQLAQMGLATVAGSATVEDAFTKTYNQRSQKRGASGQTDEQKRAVE
jgi:hypothetical protein